MLDTGDAPAVAWDPELAGAPESPPRTDNDGVRLVYTGTISGVRGSDPRPLLRALHVVRTEPALRVLNEVVLNQVLVRVVPARGDADAATRETLARVQEERVCRLVPTLWHGMDAMRISVLNWSTTEQDIDRSADSIIRAVRHARN